MHEMVPTVVVACVVAILFVSVQLSARRRAARAPSLPAEVQSSPIEVQSSGRPVPGVASEDLLELIDDGVLILNDSLTAVYANRSARSILGVGETLPARLPSDDLLSITRRVVVDGLPVEEIVELGDPSRTSFQVRALRLTSGGCVALMLRDTSEDQRTQRMRRQFVTHASHELKTPVAAIQLLAEAISNSYEDDPESTRHFIGRLLTESHRLDHLVTDLLDLSRLEDPGTIANSVADLSAVTTAALLEATPKAETKGISISRAVDEDVLVRGDAGQLALMIRNLLDNAVRYTSSADRISVEVRAKGEEAIVRVSDTGTGIPLRDQARIFERFYRVDESRSRHKGGTGLGLAIVKHVTDLHGGHVSVSSELGEGSTFTVVLPLAPGRTEDDAPPKAEIS